MPAQKGSPARLGLAIAALVAGLMAFPVGVGIGYPHLVKTGFSLATVVGIVLAVGGLLLLVGGGARLIRLTPGRRRIVVVLALPAVALLALTSLGQAVAATHVPRTAVGSLSPADHGLPFSEVQFPTADGVELSGWYIPSSNGAAIVLLHGAGSTRSAVLAHAAVLAGHGYGVLLFDARGHGRSAGRAMDFGWYGEVDTAAAVSFLQTRPEVDDERIGAVGLSMGGEEAIGAAAGDQRIRAVVAEGATNRVAADKAWLSDEFGWRGSLQEAVERLTYGITDLLTPAGPPVALRDAVAEASCPVLLIAGGAVPDEAMADRYIQSGSPRTVSLWIAPDTGHTAGLATHPTEWIQRVTDFLAAALLPQTTS